MVTAYIMIVVKPGKEKNVAARLMKSKYVQDISVVYGEYDVVMKVEVPDMRVLQDFLAEDIRKIKEVERTSTMISME